MNHLYALAAVPGGVYEIKLVPPWKAEGRRRKEQSDD